MQAVERLAKVLRRMHAKLPPLQMVPPVPQLLHTLAHGTTSGPLKWTLSHCTWWCALWKCTLTVQAASAQTLQSWTLQSEAHGTSSGQALAMRLITAEQAGLQACCIKLC